MNTPVDSFPDRIRLPDAAQPEVSLLIPTTNQAEALECCLRSLAEHLPPHIPCEVIVVLNDATPAVRSVVERQFTGLHLLSSTANLGVAGGYNLARTLARGRFLLLLHDDVETGPGWLEPLLATATAHPTAGAIGSRVLNPDGSPQRDGSLLWSNGMTSPCAAADHGGPCPVDYTGTCATLVRTALWDALGGMDEQIYPAYYVDVDLCTGLRYLGFATLCEPSSTLRHRAGASSSLDFRAFICARNQQYFVTKWAGFLTQYEPWAPDDPEATRRALARARSDAAATARTGAPPLPAPPPLADPATRETRHFKMTQTLEKEWSAHLVASLAAAREELVHAWGMVERKRQQLADKTLQITGLKARQQALKAKPARLPSPTFWQRCRRWWRPCGTPPGPE